MFTSPTLPTKATARQKGILRRVLAMLPVLSMIAASTFFTLSPVQAQVPQQLSQPAGFLDPPGRVARMNLAEGPVSFAPADTGGDPRWTSAVLNRPLTTGDRLWTGQRARSELHVGSTAVRLGEQTSLDFLTLDDDTSQLRLAQGTLKLRVRNLYNGQRIEINTPNLAFVITQPGDYRIDANPASNASAGTTRVVVQQGAGTIYGDSGAQVFITSGQQANFTDTQLTPADPAPEVQDGFDAWAHQRDRLEDQSVSARYIPREVIGYQQLDNYGDWSQDPTYGAIWLPRAVPVNWAPYRAGHWSWIAPWGWTWVDDAPWGFAPFHYGRWAQIGPRWGWVPGQLAARPVYAPALVAFIGSNAGGVNWNVSVGQQAARPGLGWFPLAPGEAFRPAYQHSPRYITNVNQNIVVTNINVTTNYRYQQRGDAVSAMSADDFARGQRVRPEVQRLNAAELGSAQVLAPGRGGLPQRLTGLRDLPRVASAVALPPATVAVRPVVTSQLLPPGQRNDRRDGRLNDLRQSDLQGNARFGRPAEGLSQQPRTGQPAQVIPPALPQQGTALDRGALEAEQRARAEQQRQQRELARQQQERAGGQRQSADESLGQRALREQALRNGTSGPVVLPAQPGPPDAGRDPIYQAQREQQRLQRDQQRQQFDAARQQEQQRRQAEELLGQRALQEHAGQQQVQAQQAQQRMQQEQQRQVREQQQQLQRQQQDQARQAGQQAAQLQAQRQQAQELQAQQRAQQDQARQQQNAQQQQLQQQLRVQQEQQSQLRQQPDQPRESGRERQPQRRADAPNGGLPRIDERGSRQRD